ncbi:MAG: hypothetical protein IPN36_16225 [Bacteroidetes bacterium]|nr:hypothetical protein [Bacteroidota bacterium]
MTKLLTIQLLISLLLLSSCKKDSNPCTPWLWGSNTTFNYDSLGNITDVDTFIYVDNMGNPVTLLEQFESNNQFYVFSDSTNDTTIAGTYNFTSNNIIINLPDSVFPFNNRTVTLLDSYNLHLYQITLLRQQVKNGLKLIFLSEES